ncbi:hypothetical protein [Risungbinella massiliensis]|uniref:hypothetical protein n=1 Tax=Risungbinella massiliensis TaxID=1329796 RepID=UPI0005CC44CD|nr:hypothetical protein [Risungbinella massiliensis]
MSPYILIPIILMVIFVIFCFIKVNEAKKQVKRLKISLEHANQGDGSEHPINSELRILLKEGKKIKAIKRAREALGLSLAEAKAYVESL